MLAAAAALVLHARAYLPFLSDDALMSLRYAARLLGGHGLTWTAGPPVEGYSNGLWVLLVALAGAAGAPRYDALVWFRRDSPALGIERRAGRVRVPAHFLNAFPHTAAELLDGRLVASVQAGRPAGVAVPRLRGRWRAEVRSSGPVTATVEPARGAVRVVLATESEVPVFVEAVVLTRLPEAAPAR